MEERTSTRENEDRTLSTMELFDISKSNLTFTKKGKFSRRNIILAGIFIVVIVIAIVFLTLYVKAEDQRKVLEKEKSEKSWQRASTTGLTPTSKVTTVSYGDGPFQNIRLPTNIRPEYYDLNLEINFGVFEVYGNVTITVSVSNPTRYVIVHGLNYKTLYGFVLNTEKKIIPYKRRFEFVKNQFYVIELEDELQPGTYYLHYNFGYPLRSDLKGFYRSNYATASGEKRVVAATQFQAVDARTAFPCFDEPSFKANFSISIKQDQKYIALSNMPFKRRNIVGDMLKTEFETTPKMPTYLIVFVVCEFANKTVIADTNAAGGTSMTYYAPPDQIDQIDYAMKVGSEVLPYFEKYYGVDYPLPKSDMIAIPDFAAGAMENWGLITYRTSALLYQDGSSAVSNKHYVALVVSHELAHQWFGNIVTMDWWSDLWLNEGFASYVEYLGMNHSEPDWKVLDFQVINDMAVGLNLDALVSSHPVYVEVTHPDEISEIFDSISYQKGGSILRMLDDFLGTGVFVKGLNLYLKKHLYGNAKTEDLWNALSEASRVAGDNINVSAIMDTWVLQMGFPVVNVDQQTQNTFQLKQSRFLSDPKPDLSESKYTSPYGYKWYIPFNYMVINVTDMNQPNVITAKQLQWMNMDAADITTGIDSTTRLVLKGNAGQDGFYRVNYDLKGWKDIIQLLNHNHKIFDVKDRAGLINDAFALANSGRLSFNVSLNLLDYIGKDDDYLPWKAASDSIAFIYKILSRIKSTKKLMQDYVKEKVSKLYEKYKFDEVTGHVQRYLQVLVVSLACDNGYQPCRDRAQQLFQDFMRDPNNNQVAGDFRSVVYYYGVYSGGEKEWDFLYKRYLTNQIASEKYKLMFGLSAAQEPWLLNRWLQHSLDEKIVRSQDVSYVYYYVANNNPIGQYIAWNFVKENWKDIEARFSKSFFTMRNIFRSVTEGFTNQYELDEVKSFVDTQIKDQGTAKRIIKQSKEKIKTNIEWLTANKDTIKDWLEKSGCGSCTTSVPTTVNPSSTLITTVDPIGNGPFENIRLSGNIRPEHYELYLAVNLGIKTVTGNVTIKVSVKKPTKYVILHAYKFDALSGIVRSSDNKKFYQKRSFEFLKNQFHVIELVNELQIGTYYLDYTFDYRLRDNLKGFYWSKYTTKSGEERLVAATQFEPVDARTAFPCFDEPSFKANFTITIKENKRYKALSNMPIQGTEINGNSMITKFKTSPIMPTYLVVFVLCEFANKTVTAKARKNVSMTYYAPPDQIDQIDYAMKVGSDILPYFENYYDVAYPLPKADMIAIPDFAAGAMENWGLITYRTSALLYQEGSSAVSNKHRVAGVVSHELAHQWFGNIVTMDWWSDLWLNEGFASYVEYLGMNHSEPDWKVLDFQVINDMAVGLNLDALVSSHPVYVEVTHPDEISEIFDSISYQKGGSILRMLDDFLGTGVFVKGLNIYLQKHSYANAKTNDLWESLSEASRLAGDNINVSTIMDTWILQMGFPVVNVSHESIGSYQLTQSRFLSDPTPDVKNTKYTSPYNYKWYIPFNYMVINVTDMNQPKIITAKQLQWMNMTGADIRTGIDSTTRLVLKGNAGQDGFYRVNYDLKGWKDIIQLLNHSHKIFDVKDRAGLINDAFALANSGRLSFNVAMNLLDYIGKDEDYLPWAAASDSISSINKVLTRTKPLKALLQNFVKEKISTLYDKYKFDKVTGHVERYLQTLVVSMACGNGYQPCRDKAQQLFQDFMRDPDNNQVAGDFRSVVYYYGVYSGGEKEWNFLYQRYLTNQIASEKYKLMFGLSAIQEPWLLNRWLQQSLDANIVKSQDVSYVFSYVARQNPIGQYIAWNFMKENWDVIQKRFSKSFFTIRRIFRSVTEGFTNQYELDEMNNFVNTKITDAGTAKRIIKQSQEKIKTNIEWLSANEKTIENWLKNKLNP